MSQGREALGSACLPALEAGRVRLQKLQCISKMLRGVRLQPVAAYQAWIICLEVTMAIRIYGQFHAGWGRDRLQAVAAYHQFAVQVLGGTIRSVCGFH